jgi:hypothetical protein
VFGGVFSSPKALLRVAQDQHQIFTMVAKPHGRQAVGPSKMSATPWQKPPEGIIKVNWDAAVDGGRKMIGMGAIVRDSDGKVLAMMCDTMIVAPQILIVLFLIYLFDNIIQLISLRSLWYYGG